MSGTTNNDAAARSESARQRATEWLEAAQGLVTAGADEALIAALVNAMAAAYLADALHEAGGNMFDLVTELPGLKSALSS